MNGGSSAPYLARTPCVPFFVHCLMGVETEGLLDYQRRAGVISIVRWNLRPVRFGVDFKSTPCVQRVARIHKGRGTERPENAGVFGHSLSLYKGSPPSLAEVRNLQNTFWKTPFGTLRSVQAIQLLRKPPSWKPSHSRLANFSENQQPGIWYMYDKVDGAGTTPIPIK